MSKELTALERYNANMEGEVEPDPIERLMFFLSLALTGQDWLDVEQFIDEVSQQLASRDAEVAELQKAIDDNWVTHQQIVAANKERDQLREQVVMLRDEVTRCRDWFEAQAKVTSKGGPSSWELMLLRDERDAADEALAATDADLGGLILCEKEPYAWVGMSGHGAIVSMTRPAVQPDLWKQCHVAAKEQGE